MALTDKLVAIADAIRGKTGKTGKILLGAMPEEITAVFAAGKQAQQQEFWSKVPAVTQKYMFAGPAWNVHTFYPQKSFSFTGNTTDYMFSFHGSSADAYDLTQRLADCGVTFDFSGVTRANYVFYSCNFTHLPEIVLSGCTKLTSTFAYSTKLHTIDGLTLAENTVFDDAFQQCTALENLTVSGTIGQNGFNVADCPLSHESLVSIVNALKSGVSGKSVTFGEGNLAKLTAAEKKIATDKGWSLL